MCPCCMSVLPPCCRPSCFSVRVKCVLGLVQLTPCNLNGNTSNTIPYRYIGSIPAEAAVACSASADSSLWRRGADVVQGGSGGGGGYCCWSPRPWRAACAARRRGPYLRRRLYLRLVNFYSDCPRIELTQNYSFILLSVFTK